MPDFFVVIIYPISIFVIEKIFEDAYLLDNVFDFFSCGKVWVIPIIWRYFVEKNLEWLVLQPRLVGYGRLDCFFFANFQNIFEPG